MPFCFEEKDVISELNGVKSALIIPCRFCPAASAAVKNNKPYFEFSGKKRVKSSFLTQLISFLFYQSFLSASYLSLSFVLQACLPEIRRILFNNICQE